MLAQKIKHVVLLNARKSFFLQSQLNDCFSFSCVKVQKYHCFVILALINWEKLSIFFTSIIRALITQGSSIAKTEELFYSNWNVWYFWTWHWSFCTLFSQAKWNINNNRNLTIFFCLLLSLLCTTYIVHLFFLSLSINIAIAVHCNYGSFSPKKNTIEKIFPTEHLQVVNLTIDFIHLALLSNFPSAVDLILSTHFRQY